MQGTYGTARMTSRASEHYPHCGWDCCRGGEGKIKADFRRTARRTEKQAWRAEVWMEVAR